MPSTKKGFLSWSKLLDSPILPTVCLTRWIIESATSDPPPWITSRGLDWLNRAQDDDGRGHYRGCKEIQKNTKNLKSEAGYHSLGYSAVSSIYSASVWSRLAQWFDWFFWSWSVPEAWKQTLESGTDTELSLSDSCRFQVGLNGFWVVTKKILVWYYMGNYIALLIPQLSNLVF